MPTAIVRAAYGVALLTVGTRVATRVVGRPLDRGETVLVYALGARHLAQAAVTAAVPGLRRPGALADAGHALSLVGIAALGPRHRRLALTDLPVAGAFAAAGLRPR